MNGIIKNIRKYYLKFLLVIFATSFIVSCEENKKDYLDDFKEFVTEIQEATFLSYEEIERLAKRFKELSVEDYDKFKSELSENEIEEIIRLKTEYYKAIAVFE